MAKPITRNTYYVNAVILVEAKSEMDAVCKSRKKLTSILPSKMPLYSLGVYSKKVGEE